jgi:murein DD-endopeptidase MepM/ murein hydrolase activator NlpD
MVISIADRFSPRFRPSRGKRPRLGLALLLFVSLAMISLTFFRMWGFKSESQIIADPMPMEELEIEQPKGILDNPFSASSKIYDEVRSGENLFTALKRLKVPAYESELVIKALSKELNVRQVRPGDVIMIESVSDNLLLNSLKVFEATSLHPQAVEIFSKDDNGIAFSVKATLNADRVASVKTSRSSVYREHALINGVVNNSIYSSIIINGGDAQLVNNFADIFAWQVDFSRESREGDTYQMVVEKNVADGRFVGYGRVLAAEYTSSNKTMRGFYFESSDGQVAGFFDDQGRSLRNAFLKAPLKLASITSRFCMRFHPVLMRMKPHNGVDYPANQGTPFMAVANGLVINAGYTRFNGNWVRIRHMNGYETEYLHATKLAKGIHVGANVKQGQVIGFVGKTGLATGYHLHFGMKKNSIYVDPTRQNFARSSGVPPRYLQEFSSNIAPMVIALNRQSPNKGTVVAYLPTKEYL